MKIPADKRKLALVVALVVVSIICLPILFSRAFKSAPPSKIQKVFFLKSAKLEAVEREPINITPLEVVSKTLSMGPTKEEKELGYYTEIPKQAKIVNVTKRDRLAIVDFNSALENYGGGATRVQGLIGQIVYSFTELPGIDEVKITINGKDEVILGGEGYSIDKPLSRRDITL
ncbi:MAG: GerMN domain-containing protein [Candidatus Saganbacteria bacterium]|nr:GerMN domain-containing protein [Candidatus Saganbacteria bacterium]